MTKEYVQVGYLRNPFGRQCRTCQYLKRRCTRTLVCSAITPSSCSQPADKAVLDSLIWRFLNAVMGHFAGKVTSYTVDNEGLHKTFVSNMGGNDSLGERLVSNL